MTKKIIGVDAESPDLRSDVPVALVDMDGTLCDCSGAIARELAKIRSPHEDPRDEEVLDPPVHIVARRRLIMSVPGFWRNLQPLPLGFQVVEMLTAVGFDIHILTKGPHDQPLAWTEKVEWCRRYVPQMPIVMTEDKGLVHGVVLVEDWPPYVRRWLRSCPHGLVIVPARPWNSGIETSFSGKCIRYNGTNLTIIRQRLEKVRDTTGVKPPALMK